LLLRTDLPLFESARKVYALIKQFYNINAGTASTVYGYSQQCHRFTKTRICKIRGMRTNFLRPRVDVQPQGAERLDVGVLRYARFLAVAGVLATIAVEVDKAVAIDWMQRLGWSYSGGAFALC